MAKDTKFLQNFLGAYAKALAKNTELIEAVRRVISIYESIVSRDIIVVNPLDEVILTKEEGEIILEIRQTDAILNKYDDVILPKIKLKCSQQTKFPIYNLFKWG